MEHKAQESFIDHTARCFFKKRVPSAIFSRLTVIIIHSTDTQGLEVLLSLMSYVPAKNVSHLSPSWLESLWLRHYLIFGALGTSTIYGRRPWKTEAVSPSAMSSATVDAALDLKSALSIVYDTLQASKHIRIWDMNVVVTAAFFCFWIRTIELCGAETDCVR